MCDIFISYSTKDRKWIERLADSLTCQGYSIWWDTSLLPGQKFHAHIQQALEKAKCVIVVWSSASVESDWVRAEASQALSRNVLIPISIDNPLIPLPFSSVHTSDFTDWNGNTEDAHFKVLTRAVDAYLVDRYGKEVSRQDTGATFTKKAVQYKTLIFVLTATIVLVLFVYGFFASLKNDKVGIGQGKVANTSTASKELEIKVVEGNVSIDIKKNNEYEKKFVDISNQLLHAYLDKEIGLNNFSAQTGYISKICGDDKEYNKITRGLTILLSYYYLAKLKHTGKTFDYYCKKRKKYGSSCFHQYGYEPYHNKPDDAGVDDIVSNVSIATVVSVIAKYIEHINYVDAKDLYAALSVLSEYYILFTKQNNEDNLRFLNSLSDRLTQESFYRLGFPKSERKCFKQMYYLADISITGYHDTMISNEAALEFYFYSFWLRRYNDGTIEKVKKIMDYSLWALGTVMTPSAYYGDSD